MMKTIMRNLFVAAGFMFAVSVSAQETAPKASVSDFHHSPKQKQNNV